MEKREREAIMRQGVTLPETPRERRELAGLEEDLRSLPARGRPTRLRLRNFRPAPASSLAADARADAYMVRLHVIEAADRGAPGAACERHGVPSADECDGDAGGLRPALARGRSRLAVRRGERPRRAPQPLVTRSSRGFPLIRRTATTRSSTGATTGFLPLDRGLGARALPGSARRRGPGRLALLPTHLRDG